MHVQILGKVDPAYGIGDHAQSTRRDHHRHDRQPVQPVGQVHRIGRAHDHDHRKRDEDKTKVDQRVLEHRQGQLVRQGIGVEISGCNTCHSGNHKAQSHANLPRNALGIILRHLCIVISKSDQPKGHRDQKNDPHIGIRRLRPQHRGKDQRRQDQQPAHSGRARFDEMPLRAIITNRLPPFLLTAQ